MWLPVDVNEDVTAVDLLWRYTVRDTLLGLLNLLPGAPGVGLRMLVYRLAFDSCGPGLFMREHVSITFPERIDVGENVGINQYVWLGADGGICIGDDVRIGPHVIIASFDHRFDDRDETIKSQGKDVERVEVEDDVWIGANAVITKGVTVGEGAVVGAGSVVTGDVAPYTVVTGTPADVVHERGTHAEGDTHSEDKHDGDDGEEVR